MEVVGEKYVKKQRRLFKLTLFALVLFIIAWVAGMYRHIFGFNPHWAGDNFAFNFMFLFPAITISILILYFTGGLTILNWRLLPNKKISTFIILISASFIGFVCYSLVMVLRQH